MGKVPPRPSGKGAPPDPFTAPGNLDTPERDVSATLNFKVSEAFKREFKTYAAMHGKPLNMLLQDAFRALKALDGP